MTDLGKQYNDDAKAGKGILDTMYHYVTGKIQDITKIKDGKVVVKSGKDFATELFKAYADAFLRFYGGVKESMVKTVRKAYDPLKLKNIIGGYVGENFLEQIIPYTAEARKRDALINHTLTGAPDQGKPSKLYQALTVPAGEKLNKGLEGILAKA